MHMPPKPLKVRATKIRTESSANNTDVSNGLTAVHCFKIQLKREKKGHMRTLHLDSPFGR